MMVMIMANTASIITEGGIEAFSLRTAAHQEKPSADLTAFGDAADIFLGLSAVHGLAPIMLAQKAAPFFDHPTFRDFVEQGLSRLLERLYPPTAGN